MASLLFLPASLGLSFSTANGSVRRLPTTKLCCGRLSSDHDSFRSRRGPLNSVAKSGDDASPDDPIPSPSNSSLPALFDKHRPRSGLYADRENYVLMEPGQDEEFVDLEELRARLKKWLENWPGSKLPADLLRYDNLDDAVTYLVDSACELEISDGSGTIQWFEIRLE